MVGNVVAGAKCARYRPHPLLALQFALFSACAWSQLATVFGTITDPSGAVIPGPAVTVVNQSTGLKNGRHGASDSPDRTIDFLACRSRYAG